MTLRRQLLLVSLLLLALPWAGCQFIREMEGAMRMGQEQSLQATAQAIAIVLGSQEKLLYPNPQRRRAKADELSLYAHSAPRAVNIDGYVNGFDDGWQFIEGRLFSGGSDSNLAVTYKAQTHNDNLYLMLEVTDSSLVYHNPGLPGPNGDRLVIRLWHNGKRQDYVILTAAPGNVRAKLLTTRQKGLNPSAIQGHWQDSQNGYTIELQIPLIYTGGRLGFYVLDHSEDSKEADTAGNIQPKEISAPPWLIYRPSNLLTLLASFRRQNDRIQVVDKDHWKLADVVANDAPSRADSDTFWLLQLMYRSILSQDNLITPPESPRPGILQGEEIRGALAGAFATKRYRDPLYQTRTIQSAAAPIVDEEGVIGAVIVRQSGEAYLSLTDRAFSRLLGYSLAALGVGALGLLGYASLLSWRIRKLSSAANNAIDADGQLTNAFPRSEARDEIGELSRHYAKLLDRVREYNDYLRTLSRKLSHELRTPIAIIQSSLDNLEQSGPETPETGIYLQRAREGLSRLQRILTAMSEANRLEESIQNNLLSELDLVPLIEELFSAYREIYPQHQLSIDIQVSSAPITGAADLIVQALDKIMENAASFCPEGGKIKLQLSSEENGWKLSLSNQGPALPPGMRDRLFDPMVSLREEQTGNVHLGLGLHIVRLIADFHHGKISAENLADDSGVVLSLRLPRIGHRH